MNDALLGGDVDLYLETSERNADQLVDSKLRFRADLHDTPEFDGERIDLVIRSPQPAARSPLHGNELPVHRVARAEGIRL